MPLLELDPGSGMFRREQLIERHAKERRHRGEERFGDQRLHDVEQDGWTLGHLHRPPEPLATRCRGLDPSDF
jgi:hypothetical protein